MAWLFLCLIPGAPCIYYGDEIGLDGRHDPDCRKGFPWQRDAWDVDLYDWYQECIRLRGKYQLGRAEQLQVVIAESSTVVFRIANATGSLLCAFNAGSVEVTVDLPANESEAVGVVLAGAAMLGPERRDGGLIRLSIPPRCGAVLAPVVST